jgi:opacity protein-like surface antigen
MSLISRKLTLAVIATSLATSPIANADWYTSLGLELGQFNTGFSTNMELEEYNVEKEAADKLNSASNIRLSVGNYVTDNVRIYAYMHGGENHFSISGPAILETIDGDMILGTEKTAFKKADDEFGLGADYLYPINKRWSLIAGGSVGYYKSKLTYAHTFKPTHIPVEMGDSLSSKTEGLAYALHTGVSFNLTKAWSLESGVKYTALDNNEHTIKSEGAYLKYNFKDANQYYLNASYVF